MCPTSYTEHLAREIIDRQLVAAGWIVQDKDKLNLAIGPGLAVRKNILLTPAPPITSFLVDRKPVGLIEAKREEEGVRIVHLLISPKS